MRKCLEIHCPVSVLNLCISRQSYYSLISDERQLIYLQSTALYRRYLDHLANQSDRSDSRIQAAEITVPALE